MSVLCSTSCFSGVARYWGDEPTEFDKILASVLDVATLPVQAPVMATAGAVKSSKNRKASARKKLLAIMVTNPSIVVRRNLHLSKEEEIRAVVIDSLKDPASTYTEEMLREILSECDREKSHVGDYVFYQGACSEAFLVNEYPRALQEAESGIRQTRLSAIVSNKKTPRALVEAVANSDALPYGVVVKARYRLLQ